MSASERRLCRWWCYVWGVDVGELQRARYVRLTTFRRDGSAVTCPVWLAPVGDGFAFTTDATSGKVKRLGNDQRVEVSVSDARGRVALGTRVFVGTAAVLLGDDVAPVRAAIMAKYGMLGRVLVLGGAVAERLRRRPTATRAAVALRLNATR